MSARLLSDFIRALRASDVRVSTGEAIDAAGAMQIVGFKDRTLLRDTLGMVLAKSPDEKEAHDRLFDLFFARDVRERNTASDDQQSGDQSDGGGPESGAQPDMQSLIESGDEAAIAMALEQAGQEAGLTDIRFPRKCLTTRKKCWARWAVRPCRKS